MREHLALPVGGSPYNRTVKARITTAIACLAAYTSLTRAQQFVEVSAQMETYSYRYEADLANATNRFAQTKLVTCVIGTSEWKIDSGTDTQWRFDGTNSYLKLGNVHNSTVHVHPADNRHPFVHAHWSLPWFVFCSGPYFQRENRRIPFPVVDPSHSPDSLAYADKTEVFEDSLGLPRVVELYASNRLFDASVTNGVFKGKRDPALWRRGSTGFKWGVPDGTLVFRYTVTESTNFLGWNIPLQAEWSFVVQGSGDFKLRPGGNLRVNSIRASARPQSVISPDVGEQNILDWRFVDVATGAETILYKPTSSNIAPTNDPHLQELWSDKVSRTARKRASP